jgi:hypothetical protein
MKEITSWHLHFLTYEPHFAVLLVQQRSTILEITLFRARIHLFFCQILLFDPFYAFHFTTKAEILPFLENLLS